MAKVFFLTHLNFCLTQSKSSSNSVFRRVSCRNCQKIPIKHCISGHNSNGFNSKRPLFINPPVLKMMLVQLQNCRCYSLRTPFFNTFLSLRVVSETSNNVFQRASRLNNIPEFTLRASKLWMSGPQDSILQHFLQPKAGPEGDIKQYQ